MTTMVEAKKKGGLVFCGGGISGYLRRSRGVGDAVHHFLILFSFIIHAPPLKYFYRRPFHSPPGDNMTTMVEAKKYRRGCFLWRRY